MMASKRVHGTSERTKEGPRMMASKRVHCTSERTKEGPRMMASKRVHGTIQRTKEASLCPQKDGPLQLLHAQEKKAVYFQPACSA